jgi:hypothetical protein
VPKTNPLMKTLRRIAQVRSFYGAPYGYASGLRLGAKPPNLHYS